MQMKQASERREQVELIQNLEKMYALKHMPRAGWVQAGISAENVESVASHSFGIALLTLILRPQLESAGLNVERALEIAVVHDLAESIIGDLTPEDGIPPKEKHRRESDAFRQLMEVVPTGERYLQLWDEFESGSSAEGKLIRRLDKLDMLVQAYLYEKRYEIRLDSFWEGMSVLFEGTESERIYASIAAHRYQIKD